MLHQIVEFWDSELSKWVQFSDDWGIIVFDDPIAAQEVYLLYAANTKARIVLV